MSDAVVGLYITFWAQQGKIDTLADAVAAMIPTAASEEGTLVYGLHRVASEGREGVSVYELYANADAQALHGRSATLDTLRAALPDLIEGAPEAYQLKPIPAGKGLPF